MVPIEQIHPLVVHFPIVFVLSLAAFDVVVVWRGVPVSGRAAFANVSAGLAACTGMAAAMAFMFGDLAFDIALTNGTPLAVLETHEELGKITAAVLVGWAAIRAVVWWRRTELSRRLSWLVVAIEVAAVALIVTTAYFGGQLVYESGVGVALKAQL